MATIYRTRISSGRMFRLQRHLLRCLYFRVCLGRGVFAFRSSTSIGSAILGRVATFAANCAALGFYRDAVVGMQTAYEGVSITLCEWGYLAGAMGAKPMIGECASWVPGHQ